MRHVDFEDDWRAVGHRRVPQDSSAAADGDPLAAPAAAPHPGPTAEPIRIQVDGRSWRWTLAAYHRDALGNEPVARFDQAHGDRWPEWWAPLDGRSLAALEDARAEVEAARPVGGEGAGED